MLCKACDVFIGYGAAGVARKPDDVPADQLDRICWVCRRTPEQLMAAGKLGRA